MDNYLGEIRLVAFNFPPANWALCNGQLLNIAQFTALFSLLGTTFGGDGRQTFGLPNLQGRVVVGQGQLNGGANYQWGQAAGSENVTLNTNQIPSHFHGLMASDQLANQPSPVQNYLPSNGGRGGGAAIYANSVGTLQGMNPSSIGPTGGGQGHPNLQPYLTLYYVIALLGIFPPRN